MKGMTMDQFDRCVKVFNEKILNLLSENNITCWVAGGSVRDYFLGLPVKTDIDIFFPDEENYEKAKNFLINNEAQTVFENNNGCKISYNKSTYDLVKKYFENPQSTIDAFDFTVSQFAVDIKMVYHGESSFIDLARKQLIINKITYPASTIKRAFRYYEKGFRACSAEIRKMIESIKPTENTNLLSEINIIATQQNENSNDSSGDNFFAGID
jgi:hypothetical protein